MKNKILRAAAVLSATVGGLALAGFANAAAYFTVPSSTASTLTSSVGDQIGDVGTLAVIAVAAGIPLGFYVIHQLIGLIPKGRSRRH